MGLVGAASARHKVSPSSPVKVKFSVSVLDGVLSGETVLSAVISVCEVVSEDELSEVAVDDASPFWQPVESIARDNNAARQIFDLV